MSIKSKVGEIVAKVKNKVKEVKQDIDQVKKLSEYQTKFENAKANYESELVLMDDRELIYLGTKQVDGNINNPVKPANGVKKANNVRNIVYELIETQVDNSVPQPNVKAKKPNQDYQSQMIEDSIRADLIEINIERLTDQQERTCPIQGKSFFEVYWDNKKKTHTTVGDIGIRLIHPKQVIPQPGVWDINDMDCFFIMSSVTKQYIKQRYDVDVDEEEEQYPQANTIAGYGYTSDLGQNAYTNLTQGSKVTEIVAWYKDKDGDIGRFVWVNNIICEDLPKILLRRDENGNIMDTETLIEDITLNQKDANGNPIIIPKGTKIPYFSPNKYPIIMRENVPLPYTFGGQSDVDIIRDQQDAIKKTTTKLQEKIMKGGSIVTLPETQRAKAKLTDEELKVIYLAPAEIGQIQVMSMQPDISKDMNFLQEQYMTAKTTLGITNSFQGIEDSANQSGKAIQLKASQSAGRMSSKQKNKYQAFKEMFEVIFQFKLAYEDEKRPFLTKDADGKPAYGEFDRYQFLTKDADGQWYYNTDFLFSADVNGGLPQDRMFILQQVIALHSAGALNNLQLWQLLETLHFPMAADIKAQQQALLDAKVNLFDKPNITILFADLPQDAQIQLLQQIGIQSQGGLSPQLQVQSQKNQNDTMLKSNAQLQSNSPDTMVQQLIDSLSPEEQKHLLSLPPEQQQQFIQQALEQIGGNSNG